MFVSDVMLVGVNAKSPYFKDRVQICTALLPPGITMATPLTLVTLWQHTYSIF